MPRSLPRLYNLDYQSPINWRAPLNRGLLSWYANLPPWSRGGTWHDLARHHHGAIRTTSSETPTTEGWSPLSHPGGAGSFDFDGTARYIALPSPKLQGGEYTMAFWAKSTCRSGDFLLEAAYGSSRFVLALGGGNWGGNARAISGIETGSSVAFGLGATDTVSDTDWNHIIVTMSVRTGGLVGYVNGVLTGEDVYYEDTFGGTGDFTVGTRASLSGSFFLGALNDFRLYNRALTPAEARALYLASRQGYPQELRRRRISRVRRARASTITVAPAKLAWQPRQITLTSPPVVFTPTVLTDLNTYEMGGRATFYLQTHNPDTGAVRDADALPTYRVYEETTSTPILTGTYALFDDANTAGLYAAEFVLDSTLGFEAGKIYLLRSSWNILDASEADIEPFTIRSTVVSVRPTRIVWQAQESTRDRVRTLSPARFAWRPIRQAATVQAVPIRPARVQWAPQGILGQRKEAGTARLGWKAQIVGSRLFVDTTSPVRFMWRPGRLRITAPFATGGALPALAGTYIAGDWLIRSQRLQLKLSLTYNPDGTWEHRLLELSDIDMSVAMAGGIASVGSVSFTIAEDGQGMSILQRWRQFATIGGTSDVTIDFRASDGDQLRVFTGIIDSISLRNGRSTVHCVDESIQRNLQLPQQLVTANLYALAGSAALTQPIPLVYGYGSHLRAIPLLLTNTSGLGYTAAAHAMSMTRTVALYNGDAQVFMSGTVTGLPVDNTATLFLSASLQQQVVNATSGGMVLFSQQATTQAQAAVDGNAATIARVMTSAVALNGDGQGVLAVVATPSPQQLGNNQAVVTLTNHRRGAQSDPTTTGTFLVQTVDFLEGTVLRSALFTTQSFRHALTPQITTQTVTNLVLGAQEAVEVVLMARNEGGPGGPNNYYEIQDISIQTGYQPPGDSFGVYLAGDFNGRRDATGRVTPGGAGTLYTLPNQVIGSLLADELHVSLATGMQAANTTYLQRNWTFAGGLGYGWQVTRGSARQILDDAARQAAAILLQDLLGGWTLRPFDPLAVPVMLFDTSTMLCEDGAQDATAQDATEITLGNMDQVHCRFEVHYAWNAGSQKFDHMVFAYENGTNVGDRDNIRYRCQLSAIRYGVTEPFIVQAYWITDRTAAVLLLEHLANYFSFQRIGITFSTTLRAMSVQLGDLIRITHPLLPEGDSPGDFEVHTMRISPMAGRIQITASKRATTYLEYFTIRDQSDVVWYWWFDEAGQLVRDSAPPNVPPLTNLDVTHQPTVPYFHHVIDENLTHIYLYPDTRGQLVIDTAPPPSGTGQDTGLGLSAIALNARRYRLSGSGAPSEIFITEDPV